MSSLRQTDLRWRFGTVMAVALAPLLAFSVWQALIDYNAAKERSMLLTTAASDVVSLGVENTVVEAGTALAVLGETLDLGAGRDACSRELELAVDQASAISGVAVLTEGGRLACMAGVLPLRDDLMGLNATFTTDVATARTFRSQTGAMRERHLIGQRDAEGRTLIATLDWAQMWESYRVMKADLQADAALLNADGKSLSGSRPDFPALKPKDFEILQPGQEARIRTTTDRRRIVMVRPTSVEGLYSAVARPEPSFFGWQRLNLLTGSLIPVLAWLFAFVAIWLAMDRMILSHLRLLREAALYFAQGDLERRVGRLPDAPSQIQQLGDTFDIMATSIGEREARLTASLEEKSVLLREIHHRVKNNLQIIISLLNMQARELDDPEGLTAIEDARNRVGAIALVHRSLYESDDLTEVDMEPFLKTLVTDMFRSLGGQARGIRLTTQLEAAEFDPEMAIPLALFIVEALSNAIKHGCPEGGTITASFVNLATIPGNQECEPYKGRMLAIRDSGTGMDEDGPTATGWRLMRGFARQMGGVLETETSADGFEVRLCF